MANFRIFQNNVTDEDRRYYRETHGFCPSDAELLKIKRGLRNGLGWFCLATVFFLAATGSYSYDWSDGRHRDNVTLAELECWKQNRADVEAGKYSNGYDRVVLNECLEGAAGHYIHNNVPKYWGWGDIKWRVKN